MTGYYYLKFHWLPEIELPHITWDSSAGLANYITLNFTG